MVQYKGSAVCKPEYNGPLFSRAETYQYAWCVHLYVLVHTRNARVALWVWPRCYISRVGERNAARDDRRVEGAIQDAVSARAKLCELASIKDSEMLLMGESLGGAIVISLAAKSPPKGLIVQSSFSSMKDAAQVHYPNLAWLVPRKKLDSTALIGSYRGPLLQSHGTADRTIPFALGERLFQAANEPKQFVAIENADHNQWLTEEYLRQLDAFIARISAAK